MRKTAGKKCSQISFIFWRWVYLVKDKTKVPFFPWREESIENNNNEKNNNTTNNENNNNSHKFKTRIGNHLIIVTRRRYRLYKVYCHLCVINMKMVYISPNPTSLHNKSLQILRKRRHVCNIYQPQIRFIVQGDVKTSKTRRPYQRHQRKPCQNAT